MSFTENEIDEVELGLHGNKSIRDLLLLIGANVTNGIAELNTTVATLQLAQEKVREDVAEILEKVNPICTFIHQFMLKQQQPRSGITLDYEVEVSSPGLDAGLKTCVFVSVDYNGMVKDLVLPETLIFQLKALQKERGIILALLKHLFPITFLRECTLTGQGSSRRLMTITSPCTSRKVLPAENVALIEAAVQKLLPITDDTNSEFGKKLLKKQKTDIRQTIRSVLQYFRDSYDESGLIKAKEKTGTKR